MRLHGCEADEERRRDLVVGEAARDQRENLALSPGELAQLLGGARRWAASCGRLERWSWRVVLVGYGLASVGLIAAGFVVRLDSAPDSDALNTVFLALMVPGMLISTIGSTVLGIALMRARYLPRVTAWLLALVFPLAFVGSAVLGHNSLGMIPIFVAWAASGWRLWAGEVRANSVDLAAAGEPHASR